MPVYYGPTLGNDGILNVLEWGGVSMPNEPHSNQGVTIIKSTGGQAGLIVPDNCILAIDGIIFRAIS